MVLLPKPTLSCCQLILNHREGEGDREWSSTKHWLSSRVRCNAMWLVNLALLSSFDICLWIFFKMLLFSLSPLMLLLYAIACLLFPLSFLFLIHLSSTFPSAVSITTTGRFLWPLNPAHETLNQPLVITQLICLKNQPFSPTPFSSEYENCITVGFKNYSSLSL